MNKKWDTFSPGRVQQPERYDAPIVSDNPNLHGRRRSPAVSPSQIEYDYSVAGLRRFQAWNEQWSRAVLRVLKPGAHAVVCGAPRAYHRMACGLEDAGFEIRDCLAWLFGQGFPKSIALADGVGTALKPANEPMVIVRKPFKGTLTNNYKRYGTGGLNIDACRVGPGRWPANAVLAHSPACTAGEECDPSCPVRLVDEQSGESVVSRRVGASRFFYVAKPSRRERDQGCDDLRPRSGGEATDRVDGSAGLRNPRAGAGRGGGARNYHPTVKPVELMRWLVRLVTPAGGVVLDPFVGSGTTGMAARYEGRGFIGIEKEAEYLAIAERRVASIDPLFLTSCGEHHARTP